MSKVKIALTKMRCLEETDEVGSDEPYVLVFAALIKNIGGLVNVPAASTTKYGPWNDVDKGDLVTTGFLTFLKPANCWGLNGKPQEIGDPADVVILVALMENDDADTGGIREGMHVQLFGSLTSYVNAGMSRADMIKKLKKDMKDVLKGITVTGIPNSDDLVGIDELAFTKAEIQKATTKAVVKTMELAGDGGKYRLAFEMTS